MPAFLGAGIYFHIAFIYPIGTKSLAFLVAISS